MTIKCRLYTLWFFKLFPKSVFQQETGTQDQWRTRSEQEPCPGGAQFSKDAQGMVAAVTNMPWNIQRLQRDEPGTLTTSSPRQIFPLASSSTPGDDSRSWLVSHDFIILKTWSPRSPYTPVLSQKKVKARGTVCGRCFWTRSRRGAHHFCLHPIP